MEFIGPGESGAVFSDDGLYRWSLWRRWEPDCPPARMCAVCGLNPSKANATDSDNTATRWINFAKAWGYGGLAVVNVFGLVETDRLKMLRHSAPIGSENDAAIAAVSSQCGIFVCCWGNEGIHLNRCNVVRHGILKGRELHHLGLTKTGMPRHPLYLPKTTVPIPWT